MTTPTSSHANGNIPQAIVTATTDSDDGTLQHIFLTEIDPIPDQPRQYFDEAELQALAESLATDGQLNAGIVYLDPETGRYKLVAGERRWLALRRLGKTTMLVRVLRAPPDKAQLSRSQLLDNELQKQLSRLEKGFAYEGHIALVGCTASALAQTVGISVSTVTRAIKDAQRLCPALKERFRAGTLPPDIAEELLTLPGDAQVAIAKHYPNQLKSKAEVKAAVRAFKKGRGQASAPTGFFTCEEEGVKVAVTLPAGRNLATVQTALKVVLEDLRKHGQHGMEHWKNFLAKKKTHALKAAQLKAAQDALAGHPNDTPERSTANG